MSTITDEIKARVDLVELIGRSVELKRVGAYYRGLCPFHAEKTPSFYVRPQTQSWHCFGCNKSGTAFDWLMEREHLEFGDPAPLADVSSASGRPLSAWGRSANAHPRPIVDGRWHSGSLSAAESRAGLNRAVLSHNPEVAGSNPAPATRKCRSEA